MSTAIGTLFHVQVANLARRPMTWVLLAILIAYLLLVSGSFLLLLAAPAEAGFDAALVLEPMRLGGIPYIAQLTAGIAAILVVIFGASIVGHEFAKGTLRTLMLTGARRRSVALAMLAVLLASCGVLAVFATVTTLAATWAFSAAAGQDLAGWQGPGHIGVTVLSLFLRLAIQFTVWGVLAFSVTLLTRSLLAGIGGVLALQIVGGIAGGLLGALGTAGRWGGRLIVTTAVDRVTLPRTLDLDGTDVVWVAVNLVAYLVLPLWWALDRFERMDLLAATRE